MSRKLKLNIFRSVFSCAADLPPICRRFVAVCYDSVASCCAEIFVPAYPAYPARLLLPGRPDCIICTDRTYAHSAVATVAAVATLLLSISLLLPGRPDCIICTGVFWNSAICSKKTVKTLYSISRPDRYLKVDFQVF
jgi:hypothetical protein